ncbi:MAG: GNAT family N-acetyltransferase [Fimbriimonas sp.]
MTIRLATEADRPALADLMPASLAHLGQGHYDADILARMVRYIAIPDPVIVGDGTYFIVERDGQTAGCGGWSRRKKLYTGSTQEEDAAEIWADPATEPAKIRAFFVHPAHTRQGIGRAILEACEDAARAAGFRMAELMALLPGVPLYTACGYQPVAEEDIILPNGTAVPCVRMTKSLPYGAAV